MRPQMAQTPPPPHSRLPSCLSCLSSNLSSPPSAVMSLQFSGVRQKKNAPAVVHPCRAVFIPGQGGVNTGLHRVFYTHCVGFRGTRPWRSLSLFSASRCCDSEDEEDTMSVSGPSERSLVDLPEKTELSEERREIKSRRDGSGGLMELLQKTTTFIDVK